MAYGIKIQLDDTTLVDETLDDVVAFDLKPDYSEQIVRKFRAETPGLNDRNNVLATLNVSVKRTHDTLTDAIAFILSMPADTERQGDVTVTIDPGETSPTEFSMPGALVRVYPQPFEGATTTLNLVFIGPLPVPPV